MTTKQTPLVETLDYAANATRSLALERVGLITDLELRVRFQYDVATAADVTEDSLAQIIKGMAIRDGQGHTWWACGDGRQLHWLDYLQYQGQVRMDEISDEDGTDKIAEALWHIHFGVNPLNPFDPSAGIPAVELGQLALEISWGAATDLAASGVTIDSGVVTVTPATILAGPQYNAVRRNILLPNVRWEKYDIAAAIGELGVQRALPAGTMLRKTLVMVVDADDTRMVTPTDQDVTEVGYIKALENTIPWKANWIALEGDMQSRLGLAAKPVGVAIINWGNIVGDAALDLRGRLPGYDYLGFTTIDTGGDIWLLHQAYSK
ncbi:hypothetical protein ES703_04125 [subsurface metagenome]